MNIQIDSIMSSYWLGVASGSVEKSLRTVGHLFNSDQVTDDIKELLNEVGADLAAIRLKIEGRQLIDLLKCRETCRETPIK